MYICENEKVMKSLFTGDQLAKAVEKIFLMDRFVQWTGERKPEIFRFLDVSGFDGDNLRIYKDNGYYVVPVGSWIVRAPDGSVHAFGEGVRFVSKMQKELQKKIDEIEIPVTIHEDKPITTYIPEDPYETEVVEEGNAISLRRKLDKDGKPILKKTFHPFPNANTAYGAMHEQKRKENETPRWKPKFIQEVDKWKK